MQETMRLEEPEPIAMEVEVREGIGLSTEMVVENLENINILEMGSAQGSLDLNHTIQSREDNGKGTLDALGFSKGNQESNNGTSRILEGTLHQKQLLAHMVLIVRE